MGGEGNRLLYNAETDVCGHTPLPALQRWEGTRGRMPLPAIQRWVYRAI